MTTDVTTQSISEKLKLKIIPLTLVVGGFALASVGAFLFFKFPFQTSSTQQTVKPSPTAIELNTTFFSLLEEYSRSLPAAQPTIFSSLDAAAKKRQAAMIHLLKTDPKKFIAMALSAHDRGLLPAGIQPMVEHEEDIQGTLLSVHGDNFKTGMATDEGYVLSTGASNGPSVDIAVYFDVMPAPALKQAFVKLHGWSLDGAFATSGSPATTPVITDAMTATVTAPKKTAVILVNFLNRTNSGTPGQAEGYFFTNPLNPKANFEEASFNQVSLVGKAAGDLIGDVYGWVTVPYSDATCDPAKWSTAADQLIGPVTLAGYDQYIYYLGQTAGCYWSGLSTGNKQYISVEFSPTLFYPKFVQTVVHELGHSFGTDHAGTIACTKNGLPVAISSTCTYGGPQEYKDPFDPMGNIYAHHFSSYRKWFFGWYADAGNDLVVTANASEKILYPQEWAGSGYKSIRIPRNFNTSGVPIDYYYLEYRRPYGAFDNFCGSSNPAALCADPAVNGVMVRIAGNATTFSKSQLLDGTPGSAGSFNDAALPAGQSINDADNGITITTNSVTTANAVVSIAFACIPKNPTMIVLFDTLAAAGHPGTFSPPISLGNLDSFACVPRDFTLTAQLPAGWTIQPVPSPITLTPKVYQNMNLSITAPAGTADGMYSIPITLTSLNLTGYSFTATIDRTIDTVPPGVTINSPLANAVYNSGLVNISATAEDTGTFVDNQKISIDGVDVKTGCLASCTYLLDMNTVATGPHTILVTAMDAAQNVGTATLNVYKSASGGGGREPFVTQ